MRSSNFFLFLLGILLVSGCNDDDDGAVRSVIISGDPEGAFYFTELAQPDTMIFVNIHRTTREFDLDNDGVMDVTIIAERDTILDGGIPTTATKMLSIAASDADNPVFVSTLNSLVRPYGRGFVINRNNSNWTALRDDAPIVLASLVQDLTNGQTEETGNWNTLREHCIGFLFPRDTEVMAWFEIGVLNGDSWIFNDHAASTLE